MSRPIWLVALLISPMVAGCLAPSEPEPGPLAGESVPSWSIGQYWEYWVSWDIENIHELVHLVVTDETEEHWYIETDHANLSWADVRNPFPFLGEVRKSDLAVLQDGEWVQYFDFPLTPGKNWTTTMNGDEVNITVTEAHRAFTVMKAYSDGALVARYSFNHFDQWFSDLKHYDEQGEETSHLNNQDEGDAFNGTLVNWDAELQGKEAETNRAGSIAFDYELKEGTGDLWFRYSWECSGQPVGSWYFVIMPKPVTDPQYVLRDGDSYCENEQMTWHLPDPPPGEWHQRITFASVPGESTATMETWTRTIQETAVSY